MNRVRLLILALVLPLAGALGGCASVTHQALQEIHIETATPAGQLVAGAACRAANDAGTFEAASGGVMAVRRSAELLELACRHPGQPDAEARLVSRGNAGLVGNVVLGGLVGAAVDHSSGAGYSYPTRVRLVFGKSLVFDRLNEKAGAPDPGVEPGQK